MAEERREWRWDRVGSRWYLEHVPCGAAASNPYQGVLSAWSEAHVEVCPALLRAAANHLR